MKKFLFISIASFGLTANAQLVVYLGSPSICAGDCATLTANASGGTLPYSYSWNPTSGLSNPTISNPITCPSATTTYTVTVTDATSSTATAWAMVNVSPAPTASISGNTTITSGNSTTLTASGGGLYWWSTGATTASISVSPTTTTLYCVYVYVGSCSDSACTTVYVIPTSVEDFINDKLISIYPNPFSAQTVLQTDNPFHNATLTVDNCFGQAVMQIKNINGQTITLHRDNLASGLYFVRLTEENKTIAVDKLVITDK